MSMHDDLRMAERAELLRDLERVSRKELPDGAAREALAEAIRCGEIDTIYRPFGYSYHVCTFARWPACRWTSIHG